MHLSYACVQRWRDGSMHKKGITVLCCILIFFFFLSRARKGKHFIMLLSRGKLRFLRERPDDFLWGTLHIAHTHALGGVDMCLFGGYDL